MSVLVWIEQNQSGLVASSCEVLGKAQEIAGQLGVPVVAAVVGADSTAAEAARVYGADRVLALVSPLLAQHRLSGCVAALRLAAEHAAATVILTAATIRGREVAATLAHQLGAGYAPDAVDLGVETGRLVAVRSIYSNNLLVDVTFTSAVQVASIRPRSFPFPETCSSASPVVVLDPGLAEADLCEQLLATRSTDHGEVSLADAAIIVSGGRGVAQNPRQGFALVAGVLGAAVGASRAAVDAGYIPYKHQVGQTGRTVKPDLYIAAGISGAIQHLAGMGGSKRIVAINPDKAAPIFEKAHYGVAGDLFQVLPALTAELKKRLGR